MHSIGTIWLWAGFLTFVVGVLVIDGFFLGKAGRVSSRKAAMWTLIWFLCAMVFNLLLYWHVAASVGHEIAQQKATEFFTGYLIEESLSIDNMFAFIIIFRFFNVPAQYQRRVLMYGVFGAILLRLIMILLGTWLISQFQWILYIFGIFLIFTGCKMLVAEEGQANLEQNSFIIALKKYGRFTEKFHQEHFFVKQNSLWYATPLFLTVILIEIADLIFAFDSIPAIFAITNDPFIVFTSNIFAILGLRALYFLLVNMEARFHLLKYGIAIVLMFIGAKMLLHHWIDIPVLLALGVIVVILTTICVLSVLIPKE